MDKVQLVLDSPYGFFIAGDTRINNGCFINSDYTINGKEVPEHWVKEIPIGRPSPKERDAQIKVLIELTERASSPEELQTMVIAKLIELKELKL